MSKLTDQLDITLIELTEATKKNNKAQDLEWYQRQEKSICEQCPLVQKKIEDG